MPHDARMLLRDIENSIGETLTFAGGCTAKSLHEDLVIRLAVERQACIIGEAMVRLRDGHPDLFARIPDAQKVIGMRNHITHRYERVEVETLAKTVNDHYPELRGQVSFVFLSL